MTTTPALAARLAAFVRDMDAAIEASPTVRALNVRAPGPTSGEPREAGDDDGGA